MQELSYEFIRIHMTIMGGQGEGTRVDVHNMKIFEPYEKFKEKKGGSPTLGGKGVGASNLIFFQC